MKPLIRLTDLTVRMLAFRKILAPLSYVSDDRYVKLYEMLGRFQFSFIMNKYRKQIDPKLGAKIERVYNRHFYSRFQFTQYTRINSQQ
ncbi:MAG: hypothetical protein JRI43_04630 [Deltaproteobacteria bacterium]|nr:hypothetical protein [Deltaproteobacteria bacterium]